MNPQVNRIVAFQEAGVTKTPQLFGPQKAVIIEFEHRDTMRMEAILHRDVP